MDFLPLCQGRVRSSIDKNASAGKWSQLPWQLCMRGGDTGFTIRILPIFPPQSTSCRSDLSFGWSPAHKLNSLLGSTRILTPWSQIKESLLFDKLWAHLGSRASGMLFRPRLWHPFKFSSSRTPGSSPTSPEWMKWLGVANFSPSNNYSRMSRTYSFSLYCRL